MATFRATVQVERVDNTGTSSEVVREIVGVTVDLTGGDNPRFYPMEVSRALDAAMTEMIARGHIPDSIES